MNKPINDGGPVFPFPLKAPERFTSQHQHAGLSIRDYFAGQALAGIRIMTPTGGIEAMSDDMLEKAMSQVWRVTDAMLKAREEAK